MRKQPKTTALMSIVANFEHLANIGVAAGFIIILTQNLHVHGKGHVVFADRYNTSPRLMEYLGKVDMDVCGTVRKKRKTTPKIHIKKMERKLPGFLECCQCSKTVMAAYGWKKNPIYTFCQMHLQMKIAAQHRGWIRKEMVKYHSNTVSR